MCPRLPRAVGCLLAVRRPPDLYITLHAATPHHHRLIHDSGLPTGAPQRYRRHHDGSARRPEAKAPAYASHVAPGGGGFRRLLVPAQLLRGVAVQPRYPVLQRPVLLLSLAGDELHLLQPLHLLLPESHLPPRAEAPPRLLLEEEEEASGQTGAGAPPRASLHPSSQDGLARRQRLVKAEARFVSL